MHRGRLPPTFDPEDNPVADLTPAGPSGTGGAQGLPPVPPIPDTLLISC